jgi:hypothetical protein
MRGYPTRRFVSTDQIIRTRIVIAVVVLGALIEGCSSPSVPASDQRPIALRIHVTDTASRPISGAQVDASRSNGTLVQGTPLMSDLNGNAVLTLAEPSTIVLRISHAGFESVGWSSSVVADTDLSISLSTGRAATTIGPGPQPPSPPGSPAPPPGLAAPDLPSFTMIGDRPVCSLSEIVHPAACVNDQFGNATAICADGQRSCSDNSEACSSHSGVYCLVCPGTLCPEQ